jgi:hypothetical protein
MAKVTQMKYFPMRESIGLEEGLDWISGLADR